MNEDGGVSVASFIDSSPISGAQRCIFVMLFFVSMSDGYDTQGIAYVAPVMARDIGITLALLGPIFSANYFGLMTGAVLFGMLADRIGRKLGIIYPMAIFGVFSLATPYGHSVYSLAGFRFVAGLGLGGILPNVAAYIMEYSPRRLRSLLVNTISAFFALGSLAGGLLATWLIPAYGWQSNFRIGGGIPLLFIGVVALGMPESVRFLLLSQRDPERVVSIMRRIVPHKELAINMRFLPERKLPGSTVKHLFTEGRAYSTVLLWTAFFMTLFIVLYLITWMPTLLRQAGHPLSVAIHVTLMYSLGAIIGILITGWLADRIGSMSKILAINFSFVSFFLVLAAFSSHDVPILMLAIFLIGFTLVTGQACLNTISAAFYPTAIRGTGIGWGVGIARIGGAIAPLFGGFLLSRSFSVR